MPSADPFSIRRFVFTTALPIVVSALLAALLVSGVLYWSSLRADDIAASRQESLMRLVISQLRDQIAHDQESATVWDDAVQNVREGDLKWIDANLGSWMHSYFGHDGAIVLDAADRPIYAFINDQVAPAGPTFDALSAQMKPLVGRMRSVMDSWDGTGPSDRSLSPSVADLAVVKGRPTVISVKPIVSDTGEIEQAPGTEHLHIALRYLDTTFLADLRESYLFEELRFAWALDTKAGEAAVPLRSVAGKTLGYLIWTPYRPGSAVMSFMAPVLAVLFLVTAAVLAFLINRLYRRSVSLKRREAEVEHLALRDTLTGLGNRLTFNAGLDDLLKNRAGGDNSKVAVLYLDLDRFKNVNDTLGHPTGDQLICQFAERLVRVTRSRDVIGRIGGDEFTVALADVDDQLVADVCQRIIEAVEQPFDIDGNHISVGVSIGVSLAPTHGSTRTDLLRKADIALYHAKSAGRGRYAVFGQDMDAIVQERRSIEQDFRRALDSEDQITVLFQPLFSAASGQITGVEALARWDHPTKGRITPSVFIPVAEDTGLIERLGEKVLTIACRAARGWGSLKVAVNVSVVELRNPNYCMKVANIIMATGINPRQLELEVTESTLADKNGTCEANIAALRDFGIRIALDDFGTGFSSLSRLKQLTVD
ncbi:MAG TPA: diguanylate cyclase, partial [Tianweitania sediminis]|nr:diguanylate cyclase [Tianweitania sediminis]